MMTPLHCQATATMLLLVPLTASSLVPRLSLTKIQSVRNSNVRERMRAAGKMSSTRLSLGLDPADVVHHASILHHGATAQDSASTLDLLSSFTLAKVVVVPNQSLSPLSETIQQGPNTSVEVIPDLTSMPGGAPRSGNPFLVESFRELYNGVMKASSQDLVSGDGSLVVPARELDVVARYADLLDRAPLAAAAYALVDFFLINAEEDMAITELLEDEEEVEAIMDVENRVMVQRFLGLFAVAIATVAWSLLSYHPVPFNEL